ncbi:MAG: PaaI family thioesterase [Myxococcota bacterium]
MSDLDQNARAIVEKVIVGSPYGRLLGLSLESCEPDRVVVRLPYRTDVTTIGDTVHGGAIAGLVDAAATAAFWAKSGLSAGSRGTTIGFSLSFLSAGRAVDLLAEARVRRRGREICNGEVVVRNPEGAEVAQAIVTYKLSS